MKKLIFLLFISVSIISCSKESDLTPAASSSGAGKSTSKLSTGVNVKLYKAFTSYNAKYGYYAYTRRFQAEVRNLAYDKKVFISQELGDGTWRDFPMTYMSSTTDNSEIWVADLTATNFGEQASTLTFGDEFVVRYEVLGAKYWDNNNNMNYKMDYSDGTYLRSDVNVSVDTYYSSFYSYSISFSINVDVRNIAYAKEVSVVYTTDGWATNQRVALSYTPSYSTGAMQSVQSPNKYNIERWIGTFNVNSSVNKVEYAVVYKVNGIEYWDNNFGKNYTLIRM